MIIIKLQGGLGNQMFQYATALALSEKTGKKLELDPVFYEDINDRSFCLDVFNVPLNFVSKLASKVYRNDLNPLLKKLITLFPSYRCYIYTESQYQFNPHLMDIKKKISI